MPGTVRALAGNLPPARDFHFVAGAGHFAFLAPCSQAAQSALPLVCADAAGFDRAAFHAGMNASVLAFFVRTLAPAPALR